MEKHVLFSPFLLFFLFLFWGGGGWGGVVVAVENVLTGGNHSMTTYPVLLLTLPLAESEARRTWRLFSVV